MTKVLREINQNRWYKSETRIWLDREEVPADSVTDLKTGQNCLSLWIIDDSSRINRLAAALRAKRKSAKFDYLLFEIDVIAKAEIECTDSNGGTPDEEVNHWHLDLINLSGKRLVKLVKEIISSNYKTDRLLPEKVDDAVRSSVESGAIQFQDLSNPYQELLSDLRNE